MRPDAAVCDKRTSVALPRYTSNPALAVDPVGHWHRAVPSSTTAAPGSGTGQLGGLVLPTYTQHIISPLGNYLTNNCLSLIRHSQINQYLVLTLPVIQYPLGVCEYSEF